MGEQGDGRGPAARQGGLRGFFTSLPGILTGVAALLTAVVGLLTFLNQGGEDGPPDEWVGRVNQLCLTAADRIDAIQLALTPEGAPQWSLFYADHSEVMERLVEEFKQVPPPAGQESLAADLIDLWSQSAQRFLVASIAASETRQNAEAEAAYGHIIRAGRMAAGVGAVACTDLPKD